MAFSRFTSCYIVWCRLVRGATAFLFFFFNDTATTEIYTLSLHDALPIYRLGCPRPVVLAQVGDARRQARDNWARRSEEHTSELQSQSNLVCRLLLEKKKKKTQMRIQTMNPRPKTTDAVNRHA